MPTYFRDMLPVELHVPQDIETHKHMVPSGKGHGKGYPHNLVNAMFKPSHY